MTDGKVSVSIKASNSVMLIDFFLLRVKILQAFRVAYPERMQLFGSWLYLGVEEILFQRLRADIPELAPRNTEGWYRLW